MRPLLDEVWFCALRDDVRLARLTPATSRSARNPTEALAWVAAVDEPNAALIEATRDRADLHRPQRGAGDSSLRGVAAACRRAT